MDNKINATDEQKIDPSYDLPKASVINLPKRDLTLKRSNSYNNLEGKECPFRSAIGFESSSDKRAAEAQHKAWCSELDLRAASLRAQVEQKLVHIEADVQRRQSLASGSETSSSDGDLANTMQLLDVKRSHSYSVSEMKDSVIVRLQEELDKAQQELKLKDEKVSLLTKVRDEIGVEIEELTASLFEEANKMVQEAKTKQAKAEKQCKEANMQLSVLQDEITALKSLVTSKLIHTSMPLKDSPRSQGESLKSKFMFMTSRLTPNQARGVSKLSDTPDSHNMRDQSSGYEFLPTGYKAQYEPDPILHREFVAWRQNPVMDKNTPFLQRIYAEDINLCMNFKNQQLSEQVIHAIETRTFAMEPVSKTQKFPKMCALLQTPRFCRYVMTIGATDQYYVSVLGRNRIAAICELINFLRYIQDGLINDSVNEVYLEVLRKRKAVAVARLGLTETETAEMQFFV